MSLNRSDPLSEIERYISELNGEPLLSSVRKALEDGVDPYKILDSLRRGMESVGQLYERGEYFISELVYAGELMKEAIEILQPYFKVDKAATRTPIVLGSALGDVHDIGKNIVKSLLISSGFNVHDLGVDVAPDRFVEKAREVGAGIIGVSALLSTTTTVASEVVKALKKAGLRDKVRVILGGAAVRGWMIREFGVDAAVNDAIQGIKIIRSWTGEG